VADRIRATVKQSFSHGRGRIVEVERISARGRPVIHLPKKKKKKKVAVPQPKDAANARGVKTAKTNQKKTAGGPTRASSNIQGKRRTHKPKQVAQPVTPGASKFRNRTKSIVALVAEHKKATATEREMAMAKALSRKSPRSRRSVFESPGAAKKGGKVRSGPASTHRRGKPSKSYATGLSRGMPGNEESDP